MLKRLNEKQVEEGRRDETKGDGSKEWGAERVVEGKTVTTLNSQKGHLLAGRRLPSERALVNVATIAPIVEDKGGVKGELLEVKGARSMLSE